jgi:cobalt/nickel transport protein
MKTQNTLLALGVLMLAVLPLVLISPGPDGAPIFAGADDKATAAIEALRPGYEPWFAPIWTPPSGEIASLLFGLQAAIGAGALAYCLGYWRGRRRGQEDAARRGQGDAARH